MKIGITLYPYGEEHPAGLAETIFSLSQSLSELPEKNSLVFLAKGSHQKTPDFVVKNSHCEFRTVSSKNLWLDDAVKNNTDIDVWIFNTPMLPLFHKPKKSIVIALDFAYLHYKPNAVKELFKTKIVELLNKRALKKAGKIVCISEFTKDEVVKWFPQVSKQKISTIMAGYRDLNLIEPEAFAPTLPPKFYLSLGIIKYRKNQLNVVEAFLRAKEKGLVGKLVVCGKGGGEYMKKINLVVESSEYKDDVIFAGYVTDGQVVSAYKNATALVFPSRMEGFGFPVLEAMSMGVPVITSNTNSVAEVAGSAAITVDPESIEEISNAILAMSTSETQQKYRDLGYTRVKDFSWEKTAYKLMKVVESI